MKAVNEHDAVVRFLDQNGDEISDGDSAQDGLQIDLNEGITAVKVAVTSPDGRVTRSYTVFFRQPTSCATDGVVPDPTASPGLVTDCETLLAARDTLAGTVTLNWSSDTPIARWDGVGRRGNSGARHEIGPREVGADRQNTAGTRESYRTAGSFSPSQ